ncbi:MAG: phosphotransferase family protein [Candidatus Zhuqueibacterota bacterium]
MHSTTIDHITEFIYDNKNKWDVGLENKDISLISRSSTWLGESGKTVYLVFEKKAKRPTLILKTVANREVGSVIEKEAKNVLFLWEKFPGICQGVVPEPVELAEFNGLPVYVEKAVPGTTLPELAGNTWTEKRKYAILDDCTEFGYRWLVKLINSARVKYKKLDKNDIENLLIRKIRLFQDTYTYKKQGSLVGLEKFAEKLEGSEFPLVPGHGDLWGGSLLWGIHKQWTIIDWEFFSINAMPFFDFFMLAVHPGICFTKKKCCLLDEFTSCFLDNPHTRLVRYSLTALAERLKVEASFIRFMFMMFLISMSLERDDVSKQGVLDEKTTWKSCITYYLNNKESIKILP